MDRIEIRGLRVYGRHGVLEREQRDGQPFVVDVTLDVDLSQASASDALADTIDYGRLAARLATAVGTTRFDLIEALAGHLADLALEDPWVTAAEVRVAKPEAPIPLDFAEVAVTVRRKARACATSVAPCGDCGFDWSLSFDAGVRCVTQAPDRYVEAFAVSGDEPAVPGGWSPRQYLWHVVDVLRYGTERLRTLRLDPDSGAIAWDADRAMAVRARSPHSVTVGLAELRSAAAAWHDAATEAPQHAVVVHPDLGLLNRLDMVRRNAHEVVHHEQDIQRGLRPHSPTVWREAP